VLIVAGDRSQARIVEGYAGPPGQEYFTNAVTEVVVGSGAVVDHYKLQRESQRACHIGSMYVHGTRDSTFSSHSIAFGGALVRNDIIAVLDGARRTNAPIAVPVHEGRRGHPTFFHRDVWRELMTVADGGARAVLRTGRERVCEVEVPDRGVIRGINTREDLD